MDLPFIMMLLGVCAAALIAWNLREVLRLLVPRAALSAVKERIRGAKRHWHPRTPDDCRYCAAVIAVQAAEIVEITAWSATKGPRGARKRICSEGVSCQNEACLYFGIGVGTIHAMVSDGRRGRTDRIRRWKCQACGSKVTERKGTMLYRLKTRPGRIVEVMMLMANGLDPSAGARVHRHDDQTIQRWLKRGGKHAKALHDLYFRRLRPGFLQLDELVGMVRGDPERTFIWTAVDAGTKIIAHVKVGRRMIDDAYGFVHGLKKRLAPNHVPVFSSDGLRHYYSALTSHFGSWHEPLPGKRKRTWHVDGRLLFGMLYKIKVGRKLKDLYSRIRCGTRKSWQEAVTALGFSGKIQTAYVERANLTLRELIAPLARRTWSITRSHESLELAIEWGLCYYHFIRPHQSLRLSQARQRTPAMAARLTDHIWTVEAVLRTKIRYA